MTRTIEVQTGPRLAHGGDAVARAPDGRVVLVMGAAPEEKVEAEIVREEPRLIRARLRRVITASPHRADPPCPHFGICGGCLLQHVSAEAQVASKSSEMVEALRRIGHLDVSRVKIEPPWSGEPYHYRTRARFAVVNAAASIRLGLRRRGSNEVLPLDQCPVLASELEAALGEIAGAIQRVRGGEEIDLLLAGDAVLISGPDRLARDNPALESLVLARWVSRDESAAVLDPKGSLLLAPGVFAQSNAAGNLALLEQIERWCEAEAFAGRVLELYSGNGNFTRVLAGRALNVTAVEGDRRAQELARSVLPERVRLVSSPVEAALADLIGGQERFDAGLVDPPRAGLSESFPSAIGPLGIKALIYISCDPATFARDAGRLAAAGLGLTALRLFDFYPQTPHAEVAGLFRVAGSGMGD